MENRTIIELHRDDDGGVRVLLFIRGINELQLNEYPTFGTDKLKTSDHRGIFNGECFNASTFEFLVNKSVFKKTLTVSIEKNI